MHEISFWRRHRRLLTAGLVVVLLLLIGSCIVMVHERTQIPLGQVCGGVVAQAHAGDDVAPQRGTVRQIEQCFIQAYHQCQNASILVTWMGTDTSETQTFTIEPQNGHCQIISSSHAHRVGDGGLVGLLQAQTTTDTCQGLTLTTNSLIVTRCGNGDNPIPRTEDCGEIYHGNGAGNNKQAEDCFMQDKLRCYPAVLYASGSDRLSNVFRINGTCKIIRTADRSFNSPEVMCTGMIQQVDSLHFQGCGSNSEILVPVNP